MVFAGVCLGSAAHAGQIPQQTVDGINWPLIPDPALTPGRVNDPPTPLETLCVPGYTTTVRHVSVATKRQVYRRYGIPYRPVDAEVDHDVPLALDGTNDVANLWPEAYVTEPANARRKDVLEVYLHHLVCTGELLLKDAQDAIRGEWRPSYEQYVGPFTAPVPKIGRRVD